MSRQPPPEAARRAAEAVARTSYGRLVALLASRTRDIAGAEDALADAFRTALETWPGQGVPDRPEAWLLVAARRRLGQAWRRRQVQEGAAATLALLQEEAASAEPDGFPDARLKLLLVCAHPAIDRGIRTPLMLQAVLGLDAARIAGAFLVAPAAMGQRLVRAKAKIRDAGIRFEAPGPEAWPERLDGVLEAIYAAYGSGWDATPGTADGGELSGEAIALGRLVAALVPGEPEAWGLLALMLHCEARAPARRGPDGAFVPLEGQDTGLWSEELAGEAEDALRRAAALRRPGRFQTEAAIQSLHRDRRLSGRRHPEALAALYDALALQTGSLGALVARAAAHGEAFGPEAGLAILGRLDGEARLAGYQPYWATLAHLLRNAGRAGEGREALARALALTADPAARAHLAAG